MKRNTIIEVIASLLVLLFIYAALSKLFDYKNFRTQLSRSPFLTNFSGMTAWMLPMGELLVVGALLFKPTRWIGLYASLFLMTMFSVYIYLMLNYSSYIPCSCGGILSKMGWKDHFLFNLLFVVLSIAGIWLESRRKTVQVDTSIN